MLLEEFESLFTGGLIDRGPREREGGNQVSFRELGTETDEDDSQERVGPLVLWADRDVFQVELGPETLDLLGRLGGVLPARRRERHGRRAARVKLGTRPSYDRR